MSQTIELLDRLLLLGMHDIAAGDLSDTAATEPERGTDAAQVL
jgi:hypothetical protein